MYVGIKRNYNPSIFSAQIRILSKIRQTKRINPLIEDFGFCLRSAESDNICISSFINQRIVSYNIFVMLAIQERLFQTIIG